MPKIGRPTIYTDELGARIALLYASGHALDTIAGMDGMPDRSTMTRWRMREGHPFAPLLARARVLKAEYHAEVGRKHLTDIDLSSIDAKKASAYVTLGGSRAKYDQWLASVLDRKTYGQTAPLTGADVAAALVLMGGLAKPPALQGTAEVSGASPAPPLPPGDDPDT